MEKNLDITNPPFNEQIWPVPSDFVKSRFHCRTSAHTPLHRTGNMHLFAHNTSPPSCTSAQKYPYILVGTMAAILDLKLPRDLCMNNGCHLGFTNPLLMPHIPRDRHPKTSKSPTYWGQRELPISY